MFHWSPIKTLMHELTGKPVERSAIIELTIYFENEIKKVIIQSKDELKKLNEIKEIQGLYQKNQSAVNCSNLYLLKKSFFYNILQNLI